MKTRLISITTLAAALCIYLAACTSPTDPGAGRNDSVLPNENSGDTGVVVIGPSPTPQVINFDFDESAPAFNTLQNYPTVTSWRLKMHSTVPTADVSTGITVHVTNRATVFGYDARGNQVASGTAYVADYNALDSWYCTIEVNGTELSMSEAGALLEDIVADIELGGDGSAFKRSPRWVLALKAAGGVAGSVVGGATVLAACFGTGGTGCPEAILVYIAAEGKFVEWVVEWYCKCIDPDASFCKEPTAVRPAQRRQLEN